ncbi:RNA polymerase subunit sigma-70 [Campylobacter sp. FMV-PI01]|uniref:RNA polymerase subunit sigma-70 n=1 Tax=Campylobacter portucalensis TaxID=2608384 RepID=A0A6L5WJ95_9BACT|nr:sigma factor-like helix-turn-helix DNA-binding protein [Campylobacter portucalensis]MSN96327.1 RNA polymerase subunit sigma-70 [Campylobacter portucalensis]
MTYAEIGKVLGLSVSRVREIEKCAITKMSHPKNKKIWMEIREILIEIEKDRAKRDSENGLF